MLKIVFLHQIVTCFFLQQRENLKKITKKYIYINKTKTIAVVKSGQN